MIRIVRKPKPIPPPRPEPVEVYGVPMLYVEGDLALDLPRYSE